MNEPLPTAAISIAAVGSKGEYLAPVSSEQRRLWYLAQKSPADTSYVMAYRLELRGRLDPDLAEAAISDVVARHEILRSRIVDRDGVPALFVAPSLDLQLERRDLVSVPAGSRDDEARRQAGDLAGTPFSLSSGPLMRCRLLRLAPDRHDLIVAMHHIIGDGWSHSVLIRDFCAFYRQRANRLDESGLPPLPLQFSDFALWQRGFETSEHCARQVDHWVQAIRGSAQNVTLPWDGSGDSLLPARHHYETLAGDLFRRLVARCRADRRLLSSVCLAAYQATLAYFGDQDRFVTGLVSANRLHAETSDLIGFFANTLILPARVEPGDGLDALMRRADDLMVAVQEHQQAPFDQVVERVGLPRAWADISPIDALFVLQNAPASAFDLPGIEVQVQRLEVAAAKFPLTLFAIEGDDEITLELDYAPNAFSEASITNFGALLKAHIESYALGRVMTVERPDLPARCSLSRREGPHCPEWTQTSVVDLIASRAEAAPEAVAVADGVGLLTYRQLMSEADRYSATLRDVLGTKPSAVAIALPRSAELLVAILAVMRAGHAWVPLDRQSPECYRRNRMSGLPVAAIIAAEAPEGLPQIPPPTLGEGTQRPPLTPMPLEPERLAYIVTTSGSTGLPKHVHVEHGALANVCRWIAETLALSPGDNTIWKTHIEFDAVNRELFPILIAGGTLVVGRAGVENDMARLAEDIATAGVTHLHCVPGQLAALATEPGLPSTLRAVICGGEALPGRLAAAVRSARPDLRVINVYGPTETTVDITAFEVGEAVDTVLPIGSPLPNVIVEVLRRGGAVPVGAAGDLHVEGCQVARGITSAEGRFITFGAPGRRSFQTGDRVLLGGDSNLRFLGRADRQIKRNGVRIEPAAIEKAIEHHPGISAAEVTALTGPGGSVRIAAFVCPTEADPAAPEPPCLWKPVFDASYGGLDRTQPPQENTHGWIDSATRAPIPPGEVLAGIDLAAERILRWRPRRILELGCGIGTLGFRLARPSADYLGIDFSEEAVAFARDHARARGIAQARFEIGDIEDLALPQSAGFDAVVLNSVVQYLADPNSLRRVLERALGDLGAGGIVFLGDLRDTRLVEAQALWRLSRSSPSSTGGEDLLVSARLDAMRDDELTIDPATLGAIAEAVGFAPPLVELKTCPGQNELVRFRYDATLVRRDVRAGINASRAAVLNRRTARNRLVCPFLEGIYPRSEVLPVSLSRQDRPERELTPGELAAEMERCHPEERILCLPGAEPDQMVCLAVPSSLSVEQLCAVMPVFRQAPPRQSSPWRRRLAGITSLDEYIRAHLPEHLRPDIVIALPELPRLVNGKRALGALRLLAEVAQRSPQGRMPEEGSDAAVIAAVFERLLGRQFGMDDDFFRGGGNSLLATQACSHIARGLGRAVPLKLFFDNPTPAALAQALTEGTDPAAATRILARTNVSDAMPSFAQRRLWFIEKLGTAETVYSIGHALRLRGGLDRVALRLALGDLHARHAPLRASFPEVDGEALVRISPPDRLLPIETLAPGLTLDAALARIEAARAEPFDLARGPLFRVLLAPLSHHDHLLALIAHHIIIDGWSMAVLLRDLESFYRRRIDPSAPTPLPLAVDYFDLAAHEAKRASAGAYRKQIAYWKEQLADAPPRLALPYDLREKGRRSWAGGQVEFEIPTMLLRGVERLCAETRTTEFMVLLAVFKVLLFRLSDTRDLVVGTVIANRHRPETEAIVGFLVNTMALRSKICPGSSFRDLLGDVRETCLAAFENQDLPFEILLEHLDVDRRWDYQAVFQAMFVLQNAPRATLDLPGVDSERVRLAAHGAMFDLGLEIRVDGDARIGLLEYATDRFERRSAERMAARYLTLIRAFIDDVDCSIQHAAMVGQAEAAEVRSFSLGPALSEVSGDSLPRRVFEIARADPERPALTQGATRISYGTLQGAIDRLTKYLSQAGVAVGERVGLLLPREPVIAAAFLAVQAARALPVYLNPDLPRERLLHLADKAGLLWIVRGSGIPPLGGWNDIVLPVDIFTKTGEMREQKSDLSAAPAYATFTSGSSGEPKAVLISQGAIAARLRANDVLFGLIGVGDRFAHAYSFDYDGGIVSLFWPLTRGAETVLLPLSTLGNTTDLASLLARERISVFDAIPAVLGQLYEGWPDVGLPNLRLVVTGGDICPPDLAARHFRHTSAVFANQYGPCEGVINASTTVFHGPEEAEREVTIGRPIPGADIFILDPAGGLCGVGIPGELVIGGEWIADEYVDAQAMTAKRFVIRDLPGLGKRRVYLSGDMGCWRNSGEIEFLGRADRQVQIDGMRVDPTEIEAVLAAQDDVQDSRVLTIDSDGRMSLAAFVVPTAEPLEDGSSLKHRWTEAFDRLYRTGASTRPNEMRDFCGWSDTATGNPLPAGQMDAWLDETLSILSQVGADSVLELGAGLGLIARSLAGRVARYVATDISEEACVRLAAAGVALRLSALEVRRMAAEEVPTAYRAERFDLIVVNSVVQYLPCAKDLRRLIAALLPLLSAQGVLFVGDVRDLRLRRRLYRSIQERRVAAGLASALAMLELPLQELLDEELHVDPALFLEATAAAGPDITATVLYKGGGGPPELVEFRYDVILRRQADPRILVPAIDGRDILPGMIGDMIDTHPGLFLVRGLSRSGEKAQIRDWLGAAQARNRSVTLLAEANPYRCTVFVHTGPTAEICALPPSPEPGSARVSPIASQPSFGDAARRLQRTLQTALAAELPAHMVPSQFYVLPGFPMRNGGKVDEKALLEHAQAHTSSEIDSGREDLALAMMKDIWSSILGSTVYSDDADFFALGGHSLLAARLAARIEREFRVGFPVMKVFELRKLDAITDFATRMASMHPTGSASTVGRLDPPHAVPPPSAQQRQIIKRYAEVPSTHQHIALALTIANDLLPASLARALDDVAQSHPILRRRYADVTRSPTNEVSPRLELLDDKADVAAWLQIGIDPLRDGPLALALAPGRELGACTLGLKAHPFAFDGVSVRILLHDLGRCYEGLNRAQPRAIPRAASCDYAAFASLYEASMNTGIIDLASLPSSPWPGELNAVSHVLTSAQLGMVDCKAARLGVTPTALYLTSYAQSLMRSGMLCRGLVECSFTGRIHLEAALSDRLIGPLSYDIPIDAAALAGLDAEEASQMAAETIASLFSGIGSSSRAALPVEAGFSYSHSHPAPGIGTSLSPSRVRLVASPQSVSMRLSLLRHPERLDARLHYPRSVITAARASALLRDILRWPAEEDHR